MTIKNNNQILLLGITLLFRTFKLVNGFYSHKDELILFKDKLNKTEITVMEGNSLAAVQPSLTLAICKCRYFYLITILAF